MLQQAACEYVGAAAWLHVPRLEVSTEFRHVPLAVLSAHELLSCLCAPSARVVVRA